MKTYFSEHHNAVYIILGGLVVRVFASVIIMPGFDEAYYGVFSFHPAMGYFDHPPIVAFTAGFGIWLSGSFSPLMLRLGALLLFTITAFFIYLTTAKLYDRNAGILSLIILHLTPYFMFGMGAFVIPDNALGLCWVIFLYSLLQVSQNDNAKWFMLSGLAFGLAMLSKYHAVFLPGGLFLLLIIFPQWRKYFKSIYLYLGFLIGLIVFLPNIIWNVNNNWITFVTQFGKGTSGGLNLSISKFLQAILVQAAYLLPWVMYGYIKATLQSTRTSSKNPGAWLTLFIWPPIIAFTMIGATRQILPHWPMPGYLAAIILCGKWLSDMEKHKKRLFLKLTFYTTAFAIAFILIQSITGLLPLNKKGDLTLDGQGWGEVIRKLEKTDNLDPKNDFLIAHKWFIGGELAFAGHNRYTVAVFNKNSPHGFVYWVEQNKLQNKDAYFITTERYPFNPDKTIGPYFNEISGPDTMITYRFTGREAQRFIVYKCKNFSGLFPYAYGRKP